MLPQSDESRSFFTAGARYTLVRRLAVAPPGERQLSVPEACAALREIFGAGRDPEIISTYQALVRGPLRPTSGDDVERMRAAIREAAERGDLLIFETRLVGSSVRREAQTQPDAPSPPPPPKTPPSPPPSKRKVIQIDAKVPGTNGKRKPTNTRPDDKLKSSTTADDSLKSNAPAILIRGCNDVQLTATTSPASEAVTWSVAPNNNKESAPGLTPGGDGRTATLKTDKAGSFSVTATLDGTKVVWNVVFVWVKVDPASSVVTLRDAGYTDDGSDLDYTTFASGTGLPGGHAWEATVKMEVLGGDSDQKLGVGKVKIHVLQNGMNDTLTGNYEDGGTALEVPKEGLPILDSSDKASAFVFTAAESRVKPANSAISDASKDRQWYSGDSPSGGFPNKHLKTHKPLKSISGANEFDAVVASVSDHAPHSIVVHAKNSWSADFSGDVTFGSDRIGTYKATGKGKTRADPKFTLISDATGGQDALAAGYETFGPIFKDGNKIKFTP